MSDPTRGFSFAARPWSVVTWAAVVYGLVVLAPAIALCSNESNSGQEVMILWMMLGGGFCLPVGLCVGLVAAARERLITRRDRPGRFAWIGFGLGAVGVAHWLAIAPFPVVAVIHGFSTVGRASTYFASAAWGLLGWVGIALCLGVMAATAAGFKRRTLAESTVLLPEIPHLIPSSGLVALLAGPLMGVATALVADWGDSSASALPMIFVVGGIGALVGLGFAWSGAAAQTAAGRSGGRVVTWAQAFGAYFGAFLAVQWSVSFAFTLLPAWSGALGQRFTIQMFCVVILGVAAGLMGRGWARAADPATTG